MGTFTELHPCRGVKLFTIHVNQDLLALLEIETIMLSLFVQFCTCGLHQLILSSPVQTMRLQYHEIKKGFKFVLLHQSSPSIIMVADCRNYWEGFRFETHANFVSKGKLKTNGESFSRLQMIELRIYMKSWFHVTHGYPNE